MKKVKLIGDERYHIIQDVPRGLIWISTYGNGLFVYDSQKEEMTHYSYHVDEFNRVNSDFLLYATVVQLVERRISIPNVAGSYPVSRSICYRGGMADTGDLKSPVGDNVPVRVGSVAPYSNINTQK